MTWQWAVIICTVLLTLCVFFVCMTAMAAVTARQKTAEAILETTENARDIAQKNPEIVELLKVVIGGRLARHISKEEPTNA